MSTTSDASPIYGPFFGVMGAASAIILSGMYLIQDGRFLRYMEIIDFFKCTKFGFPSTLN